MNWKDTYPKKTKPAYSQLLDFFQPEIRDLFTAFDQEMNRQFGVHNKYHRYSPTAGWVYGYGRSYNVELLAVTVERDCFTALGVTVRDVESLEAALGEAKAAYVGGYEERYAATCAKRREDQIARTKLRLERERAQMDELVRQVDPAKFNKFKWCKKVSRSDLERLYQGEAAGLLDGELLDDVGLTFYTRCKQAKDARACMDRGEIICHHCGAVLSARNALPGDAAQKITDHTPLHCECGYAYTYREYRRSCNAVNMPGGRATPLFEAYMEKWPRCRTAGEKMLLIDWLVHECHVTLMSDEKGRSVCVNLIEGTLKQIADLILKLAYGKVT